MILFLSDIKFLTEEQLLELTIIHIMALFFIVVVVFSYFLAKELFKKRRKSRK